METIEITYVTDDIAPEYSKKIREVKTKKELIKVIEYFMPAVSDALKVAKKFTDKDFVDFKKQIKLANRKNKDSWVLEFVQRFGAVVAPYDMIMSSMMAEQFHVPWGCAFIRHMELKNKNKN